LCFIQLSAFCVSQEAIDTAGDVTNMEGYGCRAVWSCIQLVLIEGAAPLEQIFVCQLQRVQHGSHYRRDVVQSSAQPWFRLLRFSHVRFDVSNGVIDSTQ
jgi:hypothetical protein